MAVKLRPKRPRRERPYNGGKRPEPKQPRRRCLRELCTQEVPALDVLAAQIRAVDATDAEWRPVVLHVLALQVEGFCSDRCHELHRREMQRRLWSAAIAAELVAAAIQEGAGDA